MKKIVYSYLFLAFTFIHANISQSDFSELKRIIALEESSNNYKAVNKRGFVGKYQFGASSLVDIGLVDGNKYTKSTKRVTQKDGKTKIVWKNGLTHLKFLDDPNNWLIKGGKIAFLRSERLQEKSMDDLLQINYKKIMDSGIKQTDKSTLLGLLMAAHLGGVKNALAYLKDNKEYKDLFGTKISKYFNLGKSTTGSKSVGELAKKYLGGKYTWGGTTPDKGMDCSGYTKFIYNKIGINLPRTALQQYKWNGSREIRDQLSKGDLLFFNTDPKRGLKVSHVGVYLEDNKFIHAASTKKGIIISSLDEDFYKKTFVGAKRVLDHKTNGMNTVYYAGMNMTKPLTFPQNFFKPTLEKALVAQTKIVMNLDPLVLHQGRYIRQSELNQIKEN